MFNLNDFEEFRKENDKHPSFYLDQKIIGSVTSDLNPRHIVVFSKLLFIQLLIGLLSLILCPQFEFSLTYKYDFLHYFHKNFGEEVCNFVCGSIFVGLGAMFASYILNINEINKIKSSRFLYYFSLTSILLLFFLIIGAKVYLNIILFWFLGGFLSGFLLIDFNYFMKDKILNF